MREYSKLRAETKRRMKQRKGSQENSVFLGLGHWVWGKSGTRVVLTRIWKPCFQAGHKERWKTVMDQIAPDHEFSTCSKKKKVAMALILQTTALQHLEYITLTGINWPVEVPRNLHFHKHSKQLKHAGSEPHRETLSRRSILQSSSKQWWTQHNFNGSF